MYVEKKELEEDSSSPIKHEETGDDENEDE